MDLKRKKVKKLEFLDLQARNKIMNFKENTQKRSLRLKEKLGLKSIMEVPKLQKITINMGVGEASKTKVF